MNERFEWKEEFVTGNKKLDNEHKEMLDEINQLYEMFSDTKKYNRQIAKITKHLETRMIQHFEEENALLKKYNILNSEEHIKIHNEIKNYINEIKNYNLSSLMMALFLCDIVVNYFSVHFLEYDKNFIIELNEKLEMKLDTD